MNKLILVIIKIFISAEAELSIANELQNNNVQKLIKIKNCQLLK